MTNVIDDRGSDLSCLVDVEDLPQEEAKGTSKIIISQNKVLSDENGSL